MPKKKNLVLLTSWLGEKYIDNSKYVYEFLQKYPEYKAVWMTNNDSIYKSLISKNLPVCKFKSFRGVWFQLRARVVFSSIQFADYNTWLVNRCLYIDLGHGHPIKDPGKEHFTEEHRLINSLIHNKVDYYAIVSSSFSKKRYMQVIEIPEDRIIISDFARNDVLIDEILREGKNTIIDEQRKGRKVVVYMPTHRSMGANPMKMDCILPLPELQKICEENNLFFIIKKHFYHRAEREKLTKYPCIIDITGVDDIDPQVLLYQADMLITDYSACYIDYLLLDRPLIFYQYDLGQFVEKERSLYYSFDEIKIGPVPKTGNELISSIKDIISSSEDCYRDRRNSFASTYFDNLHQENGRKKVVEIMQSLLDERQ